MMSAADRDIDTDIQLLLPSSWPDVMPPEYGTVNRN